MQSVVVHGHFYQPPRENPWRDTVDREPSAAPFHDWNERIAHECYEPVGTARVLDADGHIVRRVNLYKWLSFDAGATLLRWLEPHSPAAYAAIVDGDRESARRLGGHGNAIAMPYHHLILPLASRRDKVSEIRWGLADFRRRFGREAEGFWLPETAVDDETLAVLAEERVRFTILAPHQVEKPPERGQPLRFRAGGGRDVALFIYDGALAAGVAFGPLLKDGDALAKRLAPVPDEVPDAGTNFTLTSLATDGETFGHHHKFGEMALARAFALLSTHATVRIENFASVLARKPARREARLIAPSSWSCAHGVERWRADCGCRVSEGTSQAWRAPLRVALDWLAGRLDERFDAQGAALFAFPWRARDAFGTVAPLSDSARREFVREHMRDGSDVARALQLLDAAGARLGMFSSCAWFFDDLEGQETILMLRLAAYAIERLGNDEIENGFIARLAEAHGNEPGAGDGGALYRAQARTPRVNS